MTLEEMQTVWSEMTQRLDNQKQLTDQLIMEMTQQKFKNKIGKINTYESAGAIVCFIMAVLIFLNIEKLDTWYLLASGIFTGIYLIVIPIIVLAYIAKMRNIDLANNTYKQSLIAFTKRRTQFLFVQRFVIIFNVLLMVLILPITSKLIKGKDLFIEGGNIWVWYSAAMLLFLVPFSIWGYRGYKRMTASAQNLLKELEQ